MAQRKPFVHILVISLLMATIAAVPATTEANRTIFFAGITWDVKVGDDGPGNRCWSDDPESVWVDAEGKLHLKIRNIDGVGWCQAEIIGRTFARYGEHTFVVDTQLDTLDPDVVFAMFAYANDRSEIDIEITQAFDGTDKVWNVAQGCAPHDQLANEYSMSGDYSTHRFNWLSTGPDCAGSLTFESWHGHCDDPPCGGYMASEVYLGENVPCEEENLRPRISLWLCAADWCAGDGIPSGSDPLEVIVSNYLGSQDPGGRSEKYEILVSQDASIRAGAYQNSNYGGQPGGPAEQTLMGFGNTDQVFSDPGAEAVRLLVDFDLDGLPTDVPLESAQLQLKHAITYGSFDNPFEIQVAPFTAAWGEGSVTWANRPGTNAGSVVNECYPISGRYPLLLDIRPIVQSWLDGSLANHGVQVSAPSLESVPDNAVFYTQKENNDPDPEARLVLKFVSGIFDDGFESGNTAAWAQ